MTECLLPSRNATRNYRPQSKIYLYGVEVNNTGIVIKYYGGPQPENEVDILELCDLQNTTVYCANDHVFNSDTTVRTRGA